MYGGAAFPAMMADSGLVAEPVFPGSAARSTLPVAAGLGLRPEHAGTWRAGFPGVAFAEVHAENYMTEGSPALDLLESIARDYPVSLHGVALSLGGTDPLDRDHLARLRRLVDRFGPVSFSEHLAWSSHEGIYYNDLLPVAYDGTTLARVADHIEQTQDALGMRMLLENPATYVAFDNSSWHEIDFLAELARRTGCGLLLDVNNVAVSAHNNGFSPTAYISRFPHDLVGEIHVAGHASQDDGGQGTVLIDSHGENVADRTWYLLDLAIDFGGPKPVLLERDNHIPPVEELLPDLQRIGALLCQGQRERGA